MRAGGTGQIGVRSRVRSWRLFAWRSCYGGPLVAGLCLVVPLEGRVLAQSFSPFQNQTVTATEPRPERRPAARRPADPTLPVRKPVPAALPTAVAQPAETATAPAKSAALPAEAPDQQRVQEQAKENTPGPATAATTAPPAPEPAAAPAALPWRNPGRDGSDLKASTDPKVAAALKQCAKLLDGLDLEYEHLDPIRRGACGATAPIKLKSVGRNPAVAVSPPATVNCTVAATVHKWIKTSVQPTAEALGTSVVKIKNAASYMCRNRYGRSDTRLSEHALANALDVRAFVLASGQTIPVLGNWPYGYRPERPQVPEVPWPNPLRDHSTLPPLRHNAPGLSVFNKSTDYEQFTKEADEFAQMATHPFFKPIFAAPVQLPDPEDEEPEGPVPEGNLSRAEAKTFMRTVHGDACKMFWTVLGPEANAAHRDHFHFDMRKRRYVRICQ